jgi:hypothetical protein
LVVTVRYIRGAAEEEMWTALLELWDKLSAVREANLEKRKRGRVTGRNVRESEGKKRV